ncbi:MAG TPA: NAD(P)-dependent oxidoreductase [Streptosporangiaceae bacterium]
MRVLVAGATGAVGQQLVPALVAAGHQVIGTTRSPAKVDRLRSAGAQPVVVDGLDALAVGEAVARVEPEVIIHEMTAIPGLLSLRHLDRAFAVTNALRTRGTDHLLAAAAAAGVPRVIVQSFAGWPSMREGSPVKTEEDPLDPDPPREQRETLAAIGYLERAVTGAPLEGIVLRYGLLYGPGASEEFVALIRRRRIPVIGEGSGIWSFLHVADAAAATVAAVHRGSPGLYNVTDDEPAAVAEWLPAVARSVGGKPPRRIPVWLGRLAVGEAGVSMMTQVRGSSNAKAKRELTWQPAWASWRDGFARGLTGDRPAARLAGPS